jgi:hypothetical protein
MSRLAMQAAEQAADALLQSQANALLSTMLSRAEAGSKRAQQWVQDNLKLLDAIQKENEHA